MCLKYYGVELALLEARERSAFLLGLVLVGSHLQIKEKAVPSKEPIIMCNNYEWIRCQEMAKGKLWRVDGGCGFLP